MFACLNLLVCLPLHLWLSLSGKAGKRRSSLASGPEPVIGILPASVRTRGFRIMLAGLGFLSFVNASLLFHMVPVLTGLGLGATAVLVATVFGPAQVLSRFTNMIDGRTLGPLQLAVLMAIFAPLAILILTLSYPNVPGAMLFALIFGFGSGLSSIVFGTLPLALFGSEGYGARQGQMTLVRLAVSSTAPFGLAFLIERAGIGPVLWFLIVLSLAGLAFFIVLARLGRLSMKPA